jgi:predicted RNA-binding Zn-ribbon protein involved in translation (DUF1610 family)
MVKHCTRCRRKWIVSKYDKQEHYICPDCELKALARQERSEKSEGKQKRRTQ